MKIEKRVVLRASLDRVWRAVSEAAEFGRWFGVRFDGPFVAGTSVTATITPTVVDDEVAKRQEPHAGTTSTWHIVAVEPRRRFAYRWHPCAGEPDPEGGEPTTLVEFTLSETPEGVLLTVTESGFESLPEARRRSSFDANAEGWAMQTELVRRYTENARV
ncbi:SRPBCC family protein [Mycobacterium sp. Marseille-P9652]|uniref:SRPBCC family protein n=1 Tax=Mycobacterium sp. Marseille-P9652 TaxID=2654950 RepID=UPI0012E74FF7|nr:SRPBCC family protein [Mycobacterium sp. Marseille-P9652]